MASCFIPFTSRNLESSFFVFRQTVVLVDELIDALKRFSLSTVSLGCVNSAIFTSIHGSMIIWCGAWIKRSKENKESLDGTLQSMLKNEVLSIAVLIDYCFFDAYGGSSRDGSPTAEFYRGDTISMYSANFSSKDDIQQASYAALAIFKSNFLKMKGSSTSGVCLKSQKQHRIIGLSVWKSLEDCYSYIFDVDYREVVLPYLDDAIIRSMEFKYDIFRVAFVSGDEEKEATFNSQPHHFPASLIGNGFEVVNHKLD
ncbi:hypothetical protein LIER_38184 [Lithospermum erythrorhizon]|uniref:DUF7392 domain-containing protein n=1 Tax=Lithospermum erythrorhizon TaxID=34254 RepID=A0AAV3PVT5_LITER